MVVVYHLAFCSWTSKLSPAGLMAADFSVFSPLEALSSFGWIGVQIFFVISGFVIAMTAERASAASFLKSRVLRLAPGVWICATIGVAALAIAGVPSAMLEKQFLNSALFAPFGPWAAGAYWTLFIEIIFYSLILALLAFDRFRQIELVTVLLGLFSTSFWIAYVALNLGPGNIVFDIVSKFARHRFGEILMLQYGSFFALGTMLWLTLTKNVTRTRIAFIVLFTATCVVEIVDKSEATATYLNRGLTAETWAAPLSAWLIAMTILILSVKYNERMHDAVGSRAPFVRRLGLSTYPLYLIHDPVGAVALGLLLRASAPPYLALALVLGLLVTLSIMLDRPEQWLRRATRSAFAKLKDPAVKAAPLLFRRTQPVSS